MRSLTINAETFPIARAFTISRGSKTQAAVLSCSIGQDGVEGRGECVPYARYGETMESVHAEIEAIRAEIARGMDRRQLLTAMRAGAARNAVDCALWDLEAKLSGVAATHALGVDSPKPLETAYTLSLGEPDAMETQARENAWRPLLKVKVGTDQDEPRMRAVVEGAPHSRIILDANEGWRPDNLIRHLALAAELGIALIEQPLPAGSDDILRDVKHMVPICADESVHTAADLDGLVGLYDAINIKLDKAGGLTAALELRDSARRKGFAIMIGCMVGTSLAMAPAVLLAQGAEFVDLDGPLLLAQDRDQKLTYEGSLVSPPHPALWG
ncbi:N-acetyl-D-Glu racemase DgcA [Arvimicrobium flavum]|uniref:N-acetyl-D-Glu racemase DgcA n=1 Tax=Arvimicrobium flavum TaxID=3393320 RepID=UPI00237B639C|nr:N-acetyl-D-Glu racemase DgcA [Mesorhizobium shangrilense]